MADTYNTRFSTLTPMASLHLLQPLTFLSSHSAPLFSQYSNPISFRPSFPKNPFPLKKSLTLSFALAESDSPKSLPPDPQLLLQELAVSMAFISNFLLSDSLTSCLIFCFDCNFLYRTVLTFQEITLRSFPVIFVLMYVVYIFFLVVLSSHSVVLSYFYFFSCFVIESEYR